MSRKYLFLFLLVAAIFQGCETVDERPASYYSINGTRHELPNGFIDDDGTDLEITYRMYDVLLGDDRDYPSNYIEFTLLSNSTSRLEEGVYTYKYFYEKGYFTNLALGHDIQYDSQGVAVSGVRMLSYYMNNVTGTIQVSQEEGDYKIEFDLEFSYDNENYQIEGMYWAPLTEYYYL